MTHPLRTTVLAAALLISAHATFAQCVGDCNSNSKVAVNELVIGTNIALERAQLSACPSFDSSGNGRVEVNELITGVNNLLNDSCPVGAPVCRFSGGPPLLICLQGGACIPTSMAPSGEIGIECGTAGEGAGEGNGSERACNCLYRRFDPVEITGIGQVCIDMADAECPTGVQTCDGDSSVNLDLIAAHEEAGQCPEGNAQCAAQCDTYCAGLNPPKVRFNSGCESFCQGGDRANQPCECDTLGGTLCSRDPAPTLECPGGSCEGKDLEETISNFDKNDCHCQCIDEAAGDPGPAGALRCRLPIAIRVEANPPCNNADTLVRLPPLCAPLTTGTHNGVINSANEDSTAFVEVAQLDGASISCEDVDSGSLTGMRIVTNLGFFDSTVGDLISQLVVTCE